MAGNVLAPGHPLRGRDVSITPHGLSGGRLRSAEIVL